MLKSNFMENDFLFYSLLIFGAIVFVQVIIKLVGYFDNHSGMNDEYNEILHNMDEDDFWMNHEVHEHNDDCDHHEYHDDCDHDDD